MVAVGTSFLSGLLMAWFWSRQIRQRQEQELARVARVLTAARFPLNRAVLLQMRELSGMEFITLSGQGVVQEATLPVSQETLVNRLIAAEKRLPSSQGRVNLLADGRTYDATLVQLKPRSPDPHAVQAVVVLREQAMLSQEFSRLLPATLGAAACAVAISAGLSWWLARTITRPLVALSGATVRAAEDWSQPLPIPRRNDEVRDLALAIQQMIDQRRTFEQALRNEERKSALHEVGLGLAHQLRNMVTALQLAMDFHAESCPGGRSEDSLAVAFRQLQAMDVLLREFLSLSVAPAPHEAIIMQELLDEAVAFLRPVFQHWRVQCKLDMPRLDETPCVLRGHRSALFQLVTNLLTNALEAAHQSGPSSLVIIKLEKQGDHGILRIRDNGPGVPPEVQKRLFKSPVTSKPQGIGLGLFVSHLVATQHGGQLTWSRQEPFTEFAFRFPLLEKNQADQDVQ